MVLEFKVVQAIGFWVRRIFCSLEFGASGLSCLIFEADTQNARNLGMGFGGSGVQS